LNQENRFWQLLRPALLTAVILSIELVCTAAVRANRPEHQANPSTKFSQSVAEDLLNKDRILHHSGDSPSAAAELKKLMESIAAKNDYRLHWSDALVLRAKYREQRGEFAEAAEDMRRFFAVRPSSRWATAAGCRILAEAGNYKEAIPHLQAHIFSITNHAAPYALLSLCAASTNDYRLSAESLNKSMTVNFGKIDIPNEGQFWTEQTLKRLRDRSNSGIRHKPKDAHWHFLLGIINTLQKNYKIAINQLTDYLKLDPASWEALNVRANCFLATTDFKAAFADINRALELNPKEASNYSALERYYNMSGKFDKLFEDLDKRIARDPKNTALWIAKAHAYEALSETTKAMESYSHAVSIDPKCADAINGRGLLDEQLFKYDGAIAEFSAAIKLEPNNPHPYRDRATCYFAMHKDKETIADLSRVIELTQDPYAYGTRAECYQRLGKSDLAAHDRLIAARNVEQRH